MSSDDVRKEIAKEENPSRQQPPSLIAAHNQYTQNLINGSFRNLPPGHAKSCLYLSQHQQQITKSQRSIQSDQVNAVRF